MQQTNDELWRVQLGSGELRTMTLDALDRAFDEGAVDAHTPVLAPGAASWTTLGEAAGLEEPTEKPEQTPSLSPLTTSSDAPRAPASERPTLPDPELDASGDLDLDALSSRSRRRPALVVAAIAATLAVGAAIALVASQLGAPAVGSDVKAAAAVQAPLAATPLPPPAMKESAPPGEQRLSEEQRKRLLEADKARGDRPRAGGARAVEKPHAPKRTKQPKSSGPLLNGGDRFDPLNGAL